MVRDRKRRRLSAVPHVLQDVVYERPNASERFGRRGRKPAQGGELDALTDMLVVFRRPANSVGAVVHRIARFPDGRQQ